jgi:hypothetical protein
MRRDAIPLARHLEKLGQSAYGLYLTNLIVMNFLLLFVKNYARWLFEVPYILYPLLFIPALFVPLLLMNYTRSNGRVVYRYVYG